MHSIPDVIIMPLWCSFYRKVVCIRRHTCIGSRVGCALSVTSNLSNRFHWTPSLCVCVCVCVCVWILIKFDWRRTTLSGSTALKQVFDVKNLRPSVWRNGKQHLTPSVTNAGFNFDVARTIERRDVWWAGHNMLIIAKNWKSLKNYLVSGSWNALMWTQVKLTTPTPQGC